MCQVPRLGVESELQLSYVTATAMLDPSLICKLHHSPQHLPIITQWVRPGIEPMSSWTLVGFINHWATMGTPLGNLVLVDTEAIQAEVWNVLFGFWWILIFLCPLRKKPRGIQVTLRVWGFLTQWKVSISSLSAFREQSTSGSGRSRNSKMVFPSELNLVDFSF